MGMHQQFLVSHLYLYSLLYSEVEDTKMVTLSGFSRLSERSKVRVTKMESHVKNIIIIVTAA